jgi:PKD repeat protein
LPVASISDVPSGLRPSESFSLQGNGHPSEALGFPVTQYLWDFGDGSKATGASPTHAYAATGTYEVTLRVVDDHGFSRTTQATIQVITNKAPTIESVSFTPNPPRYDEDVQVQAMVTDPEDDDYTLSYTWWKNDQLEGKYKAATLPMDALNGMDSWTVTVTATDSFGGKASKSTGFTVPNRVPVIDDVAFVPEAPRTLDDIVVQVTGSDSDGHGVSYSYTWMRDGVQQGFSSNRLDDYRTARDQVWTVRVTPFDGYDHGESVEATVIIENTPPETASLTLTPSQPTVTQPLHVYAAATDADGDGVSWTYQWYRNGVLQADFSEATVPAEALEKSDSWRVKATPSDDALNGEGKAKAVTIQNTAPEVESAVVNPQPARAGDVVRLQLAATDADADDLQITWTLPDGTTLAGDEVESVFESAGDPSVSYEVSDGDASVTGSLRVFVQAPSSTSDSDSDSGAESGQADSSADSSQATSGTDSGPEQSTGSSSGGESSSGSDVENETSSGDHATDNDTAHEAEATTSGDLEERQESSNNEDAGSTDAHGAGEALPGHDVGALSGLGDGSDAELHGGHVESQDAPGPGFVLVLAGLALVAVARRR